MATFRCLASGNTVTFTLQHDIDSMRGHGGYVLVDEQGAQVAVEEASKELPLSPPARPRGRSRRVVETN